MLWRPKERLTLPEDDRVSGTTWSITFDLPETPSGQAVLRLDASLLIRGANVIILTPPAYGWRQGVLYDYLRLELDRNKVETK